jgi:nitrite reductase/ring-hydroxylating ferredoxin subunit
MIGSEMEYSKATVAQLSDDQLQTEWGKYLAYSYERQRLRALVQSVLRKKSPERRVNALDLAEGGLTATKVGEKEILLAKVDGKIYAIDNACGHLAYPLSEGRLDGHVVTCIWHFARFDVRTGAVVSAGIDFENLKPLEIRVSPDGSLSIDEKP